MNAGRMIRVIVRWFGARSVRQAMKDRGTGPTEGAKTAARGMKIARRFGRGLRSSEGWYRPRTYPNVHGVCSADETVLRRELVPSNGSDSSVRNGVVTQSISSRLFFPK